MDHSQWLPIARSGSLWLTLVLDSSRVALSVLRWLSLGSQWLSMASLALDSPRMAFTGFSMALTSFQWLPLAFNAFRWLSNGFHCLSKRMNLNGSRSMAQCGVRWPHKVCGSLLWMGRRGHVLAAWSVWILALNTHPPLWKINEIWPRAHRARQVGADRRLCLDY